MNPQTPDPEMLKILDLLLNWDEINEENEWETIDELDEVENEPS